MEKTGVKELTAEFKNANKPTLHGLSYALRHPETWPDDFYWDFNYCTNCAMGLAFALWSQKDVSDMSDRQVISGTAHMMSMPYEDATRIFYGNNWSPKIERERLFGLLAPEVKFTPYEKITPEMVADEIDRYLALAE